MGRGKQAVRVAVIKCVVEDAGELEVGKTEVDLPPRLRRTPAGCQGLLFLETWSHSHVNESSAE